MRVEYRIGRYQDQVLAVVDTGFSGGLTLPASMFPELFRQVGLPEGEVAVELANGQIYRAPYYLGFVKLAEIAQGTPCHIYLLGNEPLVGLKALQGLAIVVASEPKIFPLAQVVALADLLRAIDP